MVNDVSRAYLHAPCRGDIYVARCTEDLDGESPGTTCWKLLRSMYGTRPAAQDWQAAVRKAMLDIGFEAGESSPNVYVHREKGTWSMIHGDDFLLVWRGCCVGMV